jgi:hypothetical protein
MRPLQVCLATERCSSADAVRADGLKTAAGADEPFGRIVAADGPHTSAGLLAERLMERTGSGSSRQRLTRGQRIFEESCPCRQA